MSWIKPPLPRELLVALTAWQESFDAHYDPFRGWESVEIQRQWRQEGDRLIRQVRREFGPSVTVTALDWIFPEGD